eukprot:15366644-Ditylum_brightwellii.AAC.1
MEHGRSKVGPMPKEIKKPAGQIKLLITRDAWSSKQKKAMKMQLHSTHFSRHAQKKKSGRLDITVHIGDGQSDIHVGISDVPGSVFGELDLMYGSPQAATIHAKEDCKLWSIDHHEFRGITGKHRLKQPEWHLEFLRKVKIREDVGDVLCPSDIDAIALVT